MREDNQILGDPGKRRDIAIDRPEYLPEPLQGLAYLWLCQRLSKVGIHCPANVQAAGVQIEILQVDQKAFAEFADLARRKADAILFGQIAPDLFALAVTDKKSKADMNHDVAADIATRRDHSTHVPLELSTSADQQIRPVGRGVQDCLSRERVFG